MFSAEVENDAGMRAIIYGWFTYTFPFSGRLRRVLNDCELTFHQYFITKADRQTGQNHDSFETLEHLFMYHII